MTQKDVYNIQFKNHKIAWFPIVSYTHVPKSLGL